MQVIIYPTNASVYFIRPMKYQLNYFQQEDLLTENTTTDIVVGLNTHYMSVHCQWIVSISSKADKLPFKLQKHT